MAFIASVHAKAIDLIKLSLDMTTAASSGHPTSAASLAHLVTVLMYTHMRYDPACPDQVAADRLVLSEGHACPIVYAAAADLGLAIGKDPKHRRPMTRDDALRLRAIDSEIDGHPNPAEGFPFFPAATGSLGQGLSIANGLALAARLDNLGKRIFCLIGDGESREGQIWEAIDFLMDHHLTAVCPIFNCNGYGQSDAVSPQQAPDVTAARLHAAGMTVRMIDGHNPREIQRALEVHASHADNPTAKPFAIVAQTVKGWGFTSVVGHNSHGKPATEAEKAQALAALDAMAHHLGATLTKGDLRRPAVPAVEVPHPQPTQEIPSFREALRRSGQEGMLDKGAMAPRRAYGVALQVLGHTYPHVVALDADVRNSTYSEIFWHDEALRERFFECRIAEQNMLSCAGGLAAGGKLPFVSTFGKFLVRAYDQLEMGLMSRFNLKLIGSHVGVSLAADGPSQMALSDVAFFRALTTVRAQEGKALLYLLQPADAYAAYALTVAMAAHEGPCYLRTLRPDVPLLYNDATTFALGGHHVLTEGHDLCIIAAGYMVHEAQKALPLLKEQGITATLVDLYSLPFDDVAILELVQENHGQVLTVEDNYGASLGSAVADALALHGGSYTLMQMYVRQIPKSGRTPDEVLRFLQLSASDIVHTAVSMLDVASR
jgi:transketolase